MSKLLSDDRLMQNSKEDFIAESQAMQVLFRHNISKT